MNEVSLSELQDVSTSLTDSNILFSCCVALTWEYSILKPNGTDQRVHVTWTHNIW